MKQLLKLEITTKQWLSSHHHSCKSNVNGPSRTICIHMFTLVEYNDWREVIFHKSTLSKIARLASNNLLSGNYITKMQLTNRMSKPRGVVSWFQEHFRSSVTESSNLHSQRSSRLSPLVSQQNSFNINRLRTQNKNIETSNQNSGTPIRSNGCLRIKDEM